MKLQMIDLRAQRLVLEPAVSEAIAAVLDHQQFVLGPEVGELEEALRDFSGAGDVVTCANGTDALVLALRALGAGPGDAVIVPAFTFAATVEAVLLVGATPVFADIRPDTFNLDVDSIRANLGDLPATARPVGIVPVDLFGHPADHDAVGALAAEEGWWVLTDAAQGFGSSTGGRRSGALGTLATTSFFPSKPLGAYGDGGAVLCPDDRVAAVIRSLRNHGAGADRYENVRLGTNSRLDSIQAAVLLQKLAIFEREIALRQAVADRYTAAFDGTVVVPPVVLPGCLSVWAQYTVRVPQRSQVIDALDAADIAWAIHYRSSLAEQQAFAGAPTLGALTETRRATHEVLSLPMHPYLEQADQERVIDVVRSALAPVVARGGRG